MPASFSFHRIDEFVISSRKLVITDPGEHLFIVINNVHEGLFGRHGKLTAVLVKSGQCVLRQYILPVVHQVIQRHQQIPGYQRSQVGTRPYDIDIRQVVGGCQRAQLRFILGCRNPVLLDDNIGMLFSNSAIRSLYTSLSTFGDVHGCMMFKVTFSGSAASLSPEPQATVDMSSSAAVPVSSIVLSFLDVFICYTLSLYVTYRVLIFNNIRYINYTIGVVIPISAKNDFI